MDGELRRLAGRLGQANAARLAEGRLEDAGGHRPCRHDTADGRVDLEGGMHKTLPIPTVVFRARS
jgi:hypothetical protein